MDNVRDDRPTRLRGDGGFTLVELLVVITILGVLAAIAVFSVRGITDKGETSACKTDTSTIRAAQEAYSTQNNNTYAASVTALKDAGFLASESQWHATAPSGNSYVVTIDEDGFNTGDETTCGIQGHIVGVHTQAADGHEDL